ncbi:MULTISPECIES: regulatory protein RecX [unclassified Pseudoalteromonas]|uniref:regulatory protein RecX n=1 Tax=unclassified Pseudoalteromonas TaxID=194690 RepID=UPI002096A9A7|nr:regulatory protein RecX [Pseudoalteromonas sp. XMcav2-N]MCO7189716.1 recombination regulator RecX [Pseudoalteromonas sp. XMcav2-N]
MDEKQEHEKKLKNYALWLLSRQEYSRQLLAQKLRAKDAEETYITRLLDWLESLGYLDDKRYSASFLSQQVAKGLGEKRVMMDAQRKGVDKSYLQHLIEEQEVDWFSVALRAYEKKYSRSTNQLDYKEKSKRIRYMMSRGFRYDEIDYAIETHSQSE